MAKSASLQPPWLPYTLRWQYLLTCAFTSLALAIISLLMTWYSQTHHGLGNDKNSSITLFGWRFTPTLIAVLYTQLTAMLFEDVKQTEPYARMARASFSGAHASATILQTRTPWWTTLADGFSKEKNGGRRSTSLICSALINIMAFLLISPLSSSLLSTEKISVPEPSQFTAMIPKRNSAIPLNLGRETYLRTTSNFFANISTTDWITDSYAILPFWPSDQGPKLGQNVLESAGIWEATTWVFSAELSCTNMSLHSMEPIHRRYSVPFVNCTGLGMVTEEECSREYIISGPTMINGHIEKVAAVYASADGCNYTLEVPKNTLYAYSGTSGFVTWTNISSVIQDYGKFYGFRPPGFVDFFPGTGNRSGPETIFYDVDQVHINYSTKCTRKEIFLLTTPWSLDAGANITMMENVTSQCLLCSEAYYMAKLPVKLSRKLSSTTIEVDQDDFLAHRTAVPEALLNGNDVQYLGLHQNWSTAVGGVQIVNDVEGIVTTGMAAVVSAMFGRNLNGMIDNPDAITQASRLRKRFFGELLLSSITTPNASETETIRGAQTTERKRVVVVAGIGITLTVLFGISFLLYMILYWYSRPQRRPLNVVCDVSTTTGLATMFDAKNCNSALLKHLHRHDKTAVRNTLLLQRYFVQSGKIHEATSSQESIQGLNIPKSKYSSSHRWAPGALGFSALSALLAFYISLFTALIYLYDFATRRQLDQIFFVIRIDASAFGRYWTSLSPFSILITIIAVLIGLWWGAVDEALRSLEPFMSMSTSPREIASGAGMTYSYSYWVWAALKAARKRRWNLAFVALGTTLSQILIVSMSALVDIRPGQSVQQIVLRRSSEFRQIPTNFKSNSQEFYYEDMAINTVLVNDSANWLYSATNQLAMNGARPLWSLDEWSFVPLDLSQVPKLRRQHPRNSQSSLRNVTINTSALRARLECDPVEQASNTSYWVSKRNIRYPSQSLLNSGQPHSIHQLRTNAWGDTRLDETGQPISTLSEPLSFQCCTNESGKNSPSAMGHWSQVGWLSKLHAESGADVEWPFPFFSKWILGNAEHLHNVTNYSRYNEKELTADFDPLMEPDDMIFTEEPSMQVVECSPSFETAHALATVDTENGAVQSYSILDEPEPIASPWLDVFVVHGSQPCLSTCEDFNLNVTTSYGVLFMAALLSASARPYAHVVEMIGGTFMPEDLDDNAYNFRDEKTGLNLDLMTYAMYCLGDKNPEALLNVTTLTNLTQRVFQTFFQHFVGAGWVYQKLNESLPDDLPPPLDPRSNMSSTQSVYPKLNTNPTTIANISETIDVLYMSPTATWLSASILLWFILSTIITIIMQYKHAYLMIRNVECIADILILIAGSDNFLRLVKEHGDRFVSDATVSTRLGWFRKVDGEVRYGIEVVGGENAVEWVDPPEDWIAAVKERKREKKNKTWTRKVWRYFKRPTA